MKRTILTATILAVGATAVNAASLSDRIVAQLHEQGFTSVEVNSTFLGRLRFEASGDSVHREIVVNPRTGEILRDYQEAIDGPATDQPTDSDSQPPVQIASTSGGSATPSATSSVTSIISSGPTKPDSAGSLEAPHSPDTSPSPDQGSAKAKEKADKSNADKGDDKPAPKVPEAKEKSHDERRSSRETKAKK